MTIADQSMEQEKPHVLVVDDEAELCRMVVICLRQSGFRISSAGNAADAYTLLEQEPFDAVVADVIMPDEDGISLLGRVRQAWPDMPVILMTGQAQLQMAVNAIKNGAFDFVHKPFDFDHLCKIVERAVDYSKLQRMEKQYRAELEETVIHRTAELKDAMAELDYARSALLKGATEKNEFMSKISHEMRTPMNGVIGALDLLADEELSGVQAEYLSMARLSADNMVELIDQLLTFDCVKKYGGGARCNLIDLCGVLQSLVAEYQPAFARKNLTLILQIAADVPHIVWNNEEHFKRLFSILLGNALKFTDWGGVTLDVSLMVSESDGELLCFAVNDSGIGIPAGMLERIFEPFVQGDGTLTRRHGGTGLGLAIAHQNALLLNGNLLAEPAPGGGSSFKFSMKVITP